MNVPRRPKNIYFRNGNKITSKELAVYLAMAIWKINPEEVIRHIDRGLTTRTAIRQLLLYYDEETKKREEWNDKFL